jgi:hypothetical protein
MKPKTNVGRFAERELRGVDDQGAPERILIWIERRPGATWTVGRMVNPERRTNGDARESDYIFQGYELEDALEAANAALEDDVRVSEEIGVNEHVRPFRREEMLEPLEKWFFGRS